MCSSEKFLCKFKIIYICGSQLRMIKYRLILLILGILLLVESVFLAISTGVSALYSENDFAALAISTGIALFIGFVFVLLNKNVDKLVEKREAYFIITISWVVMSVFGALPFYISRYIPSFTDAFFESMSGFTTTGASVIKNVEQIPHGLLFWRSTTQWIGGMGIIVLSIAIIPFLKIGGMQLFNAEIPGVSTDKLHPRIKDTAKRLFILYVGLTIAQVILLCIGGMTVFDSINHSFTTISTGGFSTKQSNVGAWNSPYIHYVIIFFMVIAGTNFSLSYFAIVGQFKKLIKNTEFKFYLFIIIAATAIIGLGLWYYMGIHPEKAFRDSLFQVVSVLTTTGFVNSDFMKWTPHILWVVLLILMFIGGSSGSSAGGIKLVRIHILLRNSYTEFKRLIHPHAVLPVRYNKTALPSSTINNVLVFVIMYISIVVAGTIALAFTGLDFESSLGAMVACLGNCGHGIGSVSPSASFAHLSDTATWILSFAMLLGRLELLTVIIIFTRAFWKN